VIWQQRNLQIEDAKKILILSGNKVSQVLKDLMVDIHKLKRVRTRVGWEGMTVHVVRLPSRHPVDSCLT
jgi:hypothetical protein